MYTTIENKEAISKIYDRCFDIVSKHTDGELWNLDDPEISFKLRGKTNSGKCCPDYNGSYRILKFNIDILNGPERELFLYQTVVHEIAHMFQRHLFPHSKSHGKEWKSMMILLGRKPDRCSKYNHKFLKPARKTRRFSYHCNCMDHEISTVLHNRISRGIQTYLCNRCKSRLEKGKFVK